MRVPPGFTRLFPYIFARGARRYLDFLRDGLGGEIVDALDRADGALANAQVRFGDTTLMVSEASADWPATCGTYYLYVDDAEAALTRAIAAGAVTVMPVADMPYGDRQGGAKDHQGNVWWLSQRLSDGPY
jgi:PhnB protein